MKRQIRKTLTLLVMAAWVMTSMGRIIDVRIGNFYYSAPNGIAFIKSDEAAFVIDPVLGENRHKAVLFDDKGEGFAQAHLANDYNAGICAPDDSYHRMVLELNDNNLIEYEWARVGDAAVGRLVAGYADTITFDLTKNWPGFSSTYARTEKGIKGVANISNGGVTWQMNTNCPVVAFDGKSVSFSMDAYTHPMRFVAGFGVLPSLDEVDALIAKAARDYEANRPKATAPSGDLLVAMTNNLNNTRLYCSRFFDNDDGTPGAFLTKLAPLNFYPLISGAASSEQARRCLQIMADPEQFWGEWVIPTLSRKEPEYHRQRYWAGNIWGPATYLTWLGVKRYASDQMRAEYAQKCVHLFMNNWLGAGFCGENYFTLNGRVCSDPNYTWGALLCLIGIESVVDMSDEGTIMRGTGYNEPVRMENIMLGGKPYSISVDYQKPVVNLRTQ